jgi:VWFA-related protein
MKPLGPAAGLTAVLAIGALTHTAAQDPQPQAPTFRTAVDLVPVDVSIVDNGGRPVTGLTSADFTLTVDGKPRRIASAEYISAVRDLTSLPAAPSNFSSNVASGGGRLIMFVIDQGNIGVGRGRLVLDAASKFVAGLNPSDRVGVVAIPGTGPQVDFTSNHALVASMLTRLVGQASMQHLQYRIGIAEAFRLQRSDNITLNQVIARECLGLRLPEEIDVCRNQVLDDAQAVYSARRERAQNSLLALRYLVERLALTPSPKTVIFISEGLIVDRAYDEVSWIGPMAARGQVALYALHLDEPYFEAADARMSPTRRDDLTLAEEGLGLMAGLARGSVMRVVGNAEATFNRLALELSGYYLLSFEPDPGDRDGKTHKIKIEVPKRSGLEVRARSEFTVGAGAAKTEDATLADLLQAPLLANDIGLKLSTYTLRDPASEKLKILLAAEIDRSLNPDGRLALAFTLVDDKGRLIGSQIDREVKTPVHSGTKTQLYTGFILSDAPGPHTLKVAVLDDRGRRGSVEYTFRAALTSVGQIRATDLLIADNQRANSDAVTPIVGGEFTSGMLHSYIELYSDAAEVLKNATVVFEVAQNEQARALDGASGKVQPPKPESPNRLAVEGSVPLALLPPGDYVARAIVNVDGRKVGQVTRPLRIGRMVTPTRTVPPVGLRPAGSRTTTIPFSSRIERFDRGSVLAPQVVGFFLERMNFGARGEPNAASAMEHARAGRFDDAVKALSGGSSIPATFLSGLALYAKGDLEPAAGKFRDALRLDSEFFPAAFYLGSCFAAGGRDSEAVGAWQMSLVTESDAPFIYTLLGDALLRLKPPEVEHALAILNEASAEWPDDEEVQVRLGVALAMSGKRADGLQKLELYLDKHPEDHERHFIALRTLYQARAEGKVVKSREEDRAMFAKWAAAYSAAKGPQQALVDQWQKAMNK